MRLIDLHCDTIGKLSAPWPLGRGSLQKNSYAVDAERLRQADALLQVFSMYFPTGWMPAPLRGKLSFAMADRMLDCFERYRKSCRNLLPVTGFADVERCMREKKTGALLTLEDGVPIGQDLENLRHFYDRGIRLVTLTWNYENAIGYPNSKKSSLMRKGLKPFGIELLEEMNRLGVVVDVSHLSDGGFWDVVRHSKAPFVASHSNARAVTAHPRNLTDEMIRAVAERGGVIGLNFCPKFLGTDGLSRISHMLRHIQHIYRTGGEDVLAIGTDFDGIHGRLQIAGVQDMHLLLAALRNHKMPERVIEKMWNGNALRVLRDVLK